MHSILWQADPSLPLFCQFSAAEIESALDGILARNANWLKEILDADNIPVWDNLVMPLEEMDSRLSMIWSPLQHLVFVTGEASLKKTYEKFLPKISHYAMQIGQNLQLYNKILILLSFPEKLNSIQIKILKYYLYGFQLSGIHLSEDNKIKFSQLQQRMSELSNQYEENIIAETSGWNKKIIDKRLLVGLPERFVASISSCLNLQETSYLTVMRYAENRALRKEVYTAYITRASELGQYDNSQIMVDLLNIRLEQAKLLGYKCFTERTLTMRSLPSAEAILEFLYDLGERCLPKAKEELERLKEYAREKDQLHYLEPWDIEYYSEKLRSTSFEIYNEDLKNFFPIDHVLSGLFELVDQLFGIKITGVTDADVWHPDVQLFRVDGNDQCYGFFYLDLFARTDKRGGAWMDQCATRRSLKHGVYQLPITFLTCNFDKKPDEIALLSHDDVRILFHEFGHVLHHTLTKIDYAGASGVNGVAFDVLELPSLFFENWCWEKSVLKKIAKHYQTGETLSDEMLENLRKSKDFQAATKLLHRIILGIFDLRLHMYEYPINNPNFIQKIFDEVRVQFAVLPVAVFDRFQHSFSLIFSNGYAASYYGYLWSEVLASDAFAAFEENGLFDAKTGKNFLEALLQVGGSCDLIEAFRQFRGRMPTIDALLKHRGITWRKE